MSSRTVIIGGGPAGLACAYTLARERRSSLVIEKEAQAGGLCRTIDFSGYHFDIGGHRFITRSEEIGHLWQEILDGDLLKVKRLSRIYYNRRYFNYPLSFVNSFLNLGAFESFRCVLSYLRCKHFRPYGDNTLEGWIINRFGERLFQIFFKSYTEKVWGRQCQNISSDWARQRIKGLSLQVAIRKAIGGIQANAPKTLAEEFGYPKTGPGEFCCRLAEKARLRGAEFVFNKAVCKIAHTDNRVRAVEVSDAQGGGVVTIPVGYLFSSMPLPLLVRALDPLVPDEVRRAADSLSFRNFMVVNIVLNKEEVFPDQWIYVHSPEVRLGRIQNYKNWSPAMTLDPQKTSLGLEYFCDEEDALWGMNDLNLIQYGLEELEKIGIFARKYLISAFVVRYANAYPVYSMNYQADLGVIKEYLHRLSNLQCIGRAGLFRYDNSDHALLTGIYAARNYLNGGRYNLWEVNPDQGYLES